MSWIQSKNGGVVLQVKVQAGAQKSQATGFAGQPPRLKIKIAAPPVDGKANEELIYFLSKSLGIPKSKIKILRGQTAPLKDVFCQGITVDQIKVIFNYSP